MCMYHICECHCWPFRVLRLKRESDFTEQALNCKEAAVTYHISVSLRNTICCSLEPSKVSCVLHEKILFTLSSVKFALSNCLFLLLIQTALVILVHLRPFEKGCSNLAKNNGQACVKVRKYLSA